VVSEVIAMPPMPFHILFLAPKPSTYPPINLTYVVTEKPETIKKPMSRNPKANPTANDKGKRNARLISRMARTKPKPSADSNPIVLSEHSDSEVEHFLADEYPCSQVLCPEPPYDFVKNIPPFLKDNPSYLGIKMPSETLIHVSKPSPALSKPTQLSCDQYDLWLERYYIDVPILQSKIQSLEDQIIVLTGQRDKLRATDKKKKTTSSILFKNVDLATVVVNSKLA